MTPGLRVTSIPSISRKIRRIVAHRNRHQSRWSCSKKNSKLLNLLGSSLGFTVITHFHRKGLEKLIRSKGSRMLSKWMKPIQISKKLKVMYENSANASLVHRACTGPVHDKPTESEQVTTSPGTTYGWKCAAPTADSPRLDFMAAWKHSVFAHAVLGVTKCHQHHPTQTIHSFKMIQRFFRRLGPLSGYENWPPHSVKGQFHTLSSDRQ